MVVLSKLWQAAYSERTGELYKTATRGLYRWARARQRGRPRTADGWDRLLCGYIVHEYERNGSTGAGYTGASHAVAGLVMRRPELHRRLPRAWRALKGWKREHPSKHHPPLAWDLACLVAMKLALWGRWEMAVAVLLTFDCYLRGGEACHLWVEHVLVADGGDTVGIAVSTSFDKAGLPKAKTGVNQFVYVRRTGVKALLLLAARRALDAGRERVFPFTASTLRTWFKRACLTVGLPHGYTLHSLRHGSTTEDYLDSCAGRLHMTLLEIAVRGRWMNVKGAMTYIQGGRVQLLALETPDAVRKLAKRVAGRCLRWLWLEALTQ